MPVGEGPRLPSTDAGAANRRSQILIAAERVFAQEGYHATTMRGISEAAGVNLSLVVYHFEKKLTLYREVFLRRQYLNERRLGLLRAVDLTAEDAVWRIVDAFADPVLALHADPADVWFARLVLREAADPSNQQRGVIHELFDPMAEEFISSLRRARPGREDRFYRWAYLFAVGALTSSAHDARVTDLGETAPVTEGPTSAKAGLLKQFICAGWST